MTDLYIDQIGRVVDMKESDGAWNTCSRCIYNNGGKACLTQERPLDNAGYRIPCSTHYYFEEVKHD
jgi:hypothetical protein